VVSNIYTVNGTEWPYLC